MRTYLEINKNNLLANIAELKRVTHRPCLAMVKSNAYGHGLKEITDIICDEVVGLGFADIDEALHARSFTSKRMAVFGWCEIEKIKDASDNNIEIAIISLDYLKQVASRGAHIKVHLKIETGLNRFGILLKEIPKVVQILKDNPQIELKGVYSHFSAVEEGYMRSAKSQLEYFNWSLKALSGFKYISHMASSASAICLPESRFSEYRLGISLYGLYPSSSKLFKDINLKPVLSWKSQVAHITAPQMGSTIGYGNTYKVDRKIKTAVIPIGYADGYDRGLSNKGHVLINEKRCNIIGRVFMNAIIADITDAGQVKNGDEVVIIGKQGEYEILVEDIANITQTINYEAVTRINWKLPRKII